MKAFVEGWNCLFHHFIINKYIIGKQNVWKITLPLSVIKDFKHEKETKQVVIDDGLDNETENKRVQKIPLNFLKLYK